MEHGCQVPTGWAVWTGLRDGPQRAGSGDSAFLALEGVVTLCHLRGLGPTAHLTNEEGEAQRRRRRVCVWSPSPAGATWHDPRFHDQIPVQ